MRTILIVGMLLVAVSAFAWGTSDLKYIDGVGYGASVNGQPKGSIIVFHDKERGIVCYQTMLAAGTQPVPLGGLSCLPEKDVNLTFEK
jgi:hypothetical protein